MNEYPQYYYIADQATTDGVAYFYKVLDDMHADYIAIPTNKASYIRYNMPGVVYWLKYLEGMHATKITEKLYNYQLLIFHGFIE